MKKLMPTSQEGLYGNKINPAPSSTWRWVVAILIPAMVALWYFLQPEMITISTGYGELRPYTLPDGTHGTLNARSSITYPKKFTRKDRIVELIGEAWFEVQQDKQHPFKVKAQGTTTTVTGSEFDVKAYAEDSAVIVSLKDGGVQISNGKHLESLTPGQQAVVSGEHISKIDSVSFELVLDWRAKQIILEGQTLQSVLRQINRSYGVTIEVKGDLSQWPPLDLTDTLETNRPLQNLIATINIASPDIKLKYDSTNHELIVERKK